ncbi:non-ribosomal peptide synthase/polyketide synthase [Coleofasciculus sp. E1-EBD-02]|uniref:non-ribosomal peptide synthase/polyketide synthase n=1 Tax=Coleofasciculus sp. E1-EBD-02 TaxID=3068481 RepID=UPI0032F90D11
MNTEEPLISTEELPLSYAQQRLWFLDQLEPNSALYNIPIRLRLVGTLNVAALEQSLQEIIQRHEALRTNFVTVDGEPTQVIHDETTWTVSVTDLTHLSTNEQETAAKQLTHQQAIQPFDLANDSLVRARLIVLSETEHWLLICMHHIVSDGWSTGVFVQELTALYNAYSQGQPSPLTPLPIQYADFAIWQREWLQGDVLESQLSYWSNQLADAPALLELPTDRPRPAVQTFAGAHQRFTLSAQLTKKLTQLSQEQGVTLFMTLLAAFDTLLYRYTGQEDILVGSPIANRNQSEIEGLIGFFVNTLVLRTNLEGNPSFNELLSRVREMATEAYTHQDLPFEMLVEALQPERDLSYTPLFQVMFVLDNNPWDSIELTGLTVNPRPIEWAIAKFDLSLSMQTTASGLVGVWEYNTDLFDSSTIERMVNHWVILLEGIVANPQAPISQLPLLTEGERQTLLIDWNNTVETLHATSLQVDQYIHQLFEERVEQTPDAVAVIWENQHLTYRELNCRANQLAHYLRSLGVVPDTLVGLCVERSLEMIVGILGILKAGGAYIPLDPAYPKERFTYILEDTQLSLLLTQETLLIQLPDLDGKVICLDRDGSVISEQITTNPITAVQPHNLSYIIYTSGSTGTPKGVMIEHRSLVNFILTASQEYGFTSKDKLLQFSSICFDISVEEIFTCLSVGATLVLRTEAMLNSSDEFWRCCQEWQLTIISLPTAYWHQLVSELYPQDDRIYLALKKVIIGGEEAQLDKVKRWQNSVAHFPNPPQLYNAYGPTEATVAATLYQVDSVATHVPIGRSLSNIQVYILDKHLQPVPIGVPGELHIGGAGLARGYLNRPELTDEKFIANPFSTAPDSRLYKTGDRVCYLPDGNIKYLGRIDNQVKVRGFRIELGEIEAVLGQHDAVQAFCVIVREDSPGDKRLVAYIVTPSQVTPNISELRQFLKAKLPDYMVPSAFVVLESLPLTPNGKLDRRALPVPDLSGQSATYVAPRTPTEEMLALLWSQVLTVEKVGINDNFFELGGHSLLATQLVSRIRNTFKIELPLRQLFATATVVELAQAIEQLQQQNLDLIAPPILPRTEEKQLPLSYAQQRLWFLEQFAPNSALYNIPMAWHLVGTLNVAALEGSLQEIIARHEALRTNFVTVDGEATQIIPRTTNWSLSVVELTHLPTIEKEIQVQKIAKQQAIHTFDLTSEPLIKATLVVINETEYWLLIGMHHIVSDGWSMGLLMQELATLYEAYTQGQPSPLTPLPIQYADFCLWQREWLQGEVLQSQLNYWEEQLAGAPTLLSLPTDRPRPAAQSFEGATKSFEVSWELTKKLTQLSQEQGVTLFMTLLAAFLTLLYRYTGQEDMLVGTPIANRNRSEIEGIIGFFVNTLVLRGNLSGEPSFSELLARVKKVAMEAYTHQDLPFEMLVEALQPDRDLSHPPLFQVMFILQNTPTSEVELTGLTVTPVKVERDIAPFDLTLGMENTPSGLVGVFEYNTDLFEASTIERMIGHFVRLLEGIVAHPQQRISQLPLLTAGEEQQILVEWNDTDAESPASLCIHQLFEQTVQRTPDAVAVDFDNQQLTYQQLNKKANQLAHSLQSLGVGAEVLVGIYLERSLSMMVALLAIQKAGGAYVPLDPDYPIQRLAYICEDSKIKLLLTQEKLLNSLPIESVQVIVLDTESEELNAQSQENPVSEVKPENLCCLLYTSGSTGKPKGVMLTHAALVNHSSAISEVFGLTNKDRVLQFASLGFDVAAEEIFPTWFKGGTVVLRPTQMFPDLARFAQFIEQEKLTVLNITPAYWHEWTVAVSKAEATIPESLHLVAVGGDSVLPETVRLWKKLVGERVNCLNVYGPTEASVTAVVYDLLNPQLEQINNVLIGRPIANTQTYILDPHLQPVPVGVIGELHLGGVRLARGYLNRPELTAEKFLANPFKDETGHRIYKTGDLARYLPDGNIECFGRIDNQVKIRGFRIELGEIEAVLNRNIHVQTSCVILREDTLGDKRLVAYIVAHEQRHIPAISELRQYLSNHLPLYMVPNVFMFLESLPLSANRKVDRRALPKPDRESEQRSEYVAPSNPMEEMLALLWAKVLKIERVGIHDNFFELGGHSLLATQLVSRIRNSFNVELPLRELFGAATVAQLTQVIGQLQQQDSNRAIPAILPKVNDVEAPLSYAQQRLWFLDQLDPNRATYNIPMTLRLLGRLNVAALEQSLQEIVQRHQALHTNFIAVDGQPRPIIKTGTDWTVSIIDLQHLPTSEQKIEAEKIAQEQTTLPFDLANDSLIRATLVRLNETEQWLSVCMHHIVSDGWSMGVFVEELTALYEAYVKGSPSPLTPLPIQYTDFAVWQRQWLQGEVLQSQLNYWQQQLADAPELLVLPTDRPRPAMQTFVGAYQKFTLAAELSQKLTELCQEQGVTLFMMLLAAFDTLLYRYSSQTDILVGTPIANRNHSEIEGLIGFFSNTLVMRSDLSDNPSFSELLTQVRQTAMDAYAHQDLPFEMLVEALQPERNLSHTPVFQVAFVLQNTPIAEVELSGLTINEVPIENAIAKFDLTLGMQKNDTEIEGVFEYNRDLFDASTIERMVGHWVTLLESIVAYPQERVSQLPMLTEVEQQQLLVDWNQTQTDYPQSKCIHQLFEEQVARSPKAVAVVFEQEQLTYEQLNCRANQLAHYLRSQGVRPDVLVGLCVERSLSMVVGLLGILKAGGAYVPLDPEYPTERLNYMLEDAQVSVLLTQQQFVETFHGRSLPPQHQGKLVCLDDLELDNLDLAQNHHDNPNSGVQPFHLANVIYTSGSTGKPKGVMVEHSGLCNLSQAQIQTFGLHSQSRILQFASLSFDASIWEVVMALTAGGTLYLGTQDSLMPGQPLVERLRDYHITHVTLPPSALAVLPEEELAALQTIIVAGEACSPELIKKWSVTRNFFNAYGPTEASVCATIAKCNGDEKISIGRPIANTQIYILDSHLQPVPVGVPGELHIGGAGLARGYLNRDELTDEKFIANPFSNEPDSRLYKTGDLARYLRDGNIEFLGRIDNQVKIRGFRVELAEIEATLSQLPEVREAVVLAREDQSNDKRLVAYVVGQTETPLTSNEFRQFLKAKLPDYMIPSAFVLLENIPLTPNGKVDRRALKAPDVSSLQDQYVAPRTPTEATLTQIWSQVLKVEPVGINDNFFDLGGHSLLATQIISRIQEALSISLPLRSLFESPTIAQLSEEIITQLEAGLTLTVPEIVPVSRNNDIPLSWAQERLWFVHHLEGDSGAYTIDITVRLKGNLNIKALEKAFGKIVQRHEPLRTRFEMKDNKPIQVIDKDITLTLPVVDLRNQPDPWKQLKALTKEAASLPFDLANDSVLRVKLWQMSRDDYVLLFAIHHIAADGWSLGVLVEELSAYYQSFVTGHPVELPELAIQYADFAVWQRQWFTDQVLERQLNYWKNQLNDAPPLLEFPTDRPRPAVQTFRGGTEHFQFSPELTQRLKKLSQESGTTLFMTLLAGFAVLASRYSSQTDLVIGSPIANRNRQEIEGLIGFFVNTLALRFDLSQQPTFEDFLAQVRDVTQNAYDHQDLPFEMLVEELKIERHLDRHPLTQVVFALQNAPSSPFDLPGVTVEGMSSGLDSVRVDLEVYLWDEPEGLEGFCSYNRDLFDGETIGRLMQHFQTLLMAIVENQKQPVTLLPLLTPQERHQLLVEWNHTVSSRHGVETRHGASLQVNQCIHQLFEQQVKRTPDAVAVVFGEEELTYQQLNSRANQLAHYLQSLGVGADVLVGLCVERSPKMLIGLLGILKAGGAYVPLDPDYPPERISFMLSDSQVSRLVTQQHLLSQLPQHHAQPVCLESLSLDQNSQENLTGVVTASNLANVIYTSGSTGQPKGVMVEHKGLYNLALAQIEALGVHEKSRVLQFASLSFDACISEILMTLAAGATLYLGTKDALMPGTPLIERLRHYRITHITLPPSALAVLPHEELPQLQTIIVAGEACSPQLMKLWSVGRNFFNGYGPTEASVCATIAKCEPDDEKVTIGRPITNVQVYILDEQLQPVPIGVAGELHIGGVGVARGYLNRPELTQEKFIPNPFSNEPDSRLYKTGDKARYLTDGNIEFLGRIDNQVKIRGFRIELGEIEAVLNQSPLVQDAVVVAQVDSNGDKNLVAYLVGALKNQALPHQVAQWEREYVSDWQMLYEQAYGQPQAATDDSDVTFNISGWNSSYTGQPIPAQEMLEWVESTVSRILSVSPQILLEIGCGTGLLLSRIAPNCQEYWGADYASAALQQVEQICQRQGLQQVRLLHQMADDFTNIPPAKFDTVVINSVVQYFPSVEYLLQVLDGAMATLGQSGTIFVGDVRSLPLLEAYHAAVQLSRLPGDTPVEQWQQQVNQSVTAEEELVIDPSFFIALSTRFPMITAVEIEPKRGYAQNNELTQFRYDVTLHIGGEVSTPVETWLNWQLDSLSITQVENQLKIEQPEVLGIRGVPNQRVQQALQIWQWLEEPPGVETVSQLRQLLPQQPTVGINPEQFWQLGETLGYQVHLSWWESSTDGGYDLVLCRNRVTPIGFWQPETVTAKPWSEYTNNPLYGKLVQKLVPQVRQFLQQKLPNYMMPQAFVLLKALPLTPNGKVDRKALPTPDTATRHLSTGLALPRNPIEAQLVQIWSEVLGIERIGIKENFFELGGHSLLATQVISRLSNLFEVELSLQHFLEYPTVASLAQTIQVLSTVQTGQPSVTELSDDYEEGEL